MVNTKLHIDWSKVEPCGADGLDEYWCVTKKTLEMQHHVKVEGADYFRPDGKFYFFCHKQYETDIHIDLCKRCCQKLGLLW